MPLAKGLCVSEFNEALFLACGVLLDCLALLCKALFVSLSISDLLVRKLQYPKYSKNNPPITEINVTKRSKLDNLFRINIDNRIIGMSVTIGAIAIFIPWLLPFCKVSDIIIVISGPGEIPAASPNNNADNAIIIL